MRNIDTNWIFTQFIKFIPPLLFFSFIIKFCYLILFSNSNKTDFLVFWYASLWAAEGKASALYEITGFPSDVIESGGLHFPIGWFNSPSMLLVSLPFSFLPYTISIFVWLSTTLLFYVSVVKRISPHSLTLWLVLGFPATLINIGYGHNGFLSAGLLGSGLILLDKSAYLAGFLLGLLTYKPQLAALIPIALIAGKKWKSLLAFFFSSALLIISSAAVFGLDTWIAFLKKIPIMTMFLEEGYFGWIVYRNKMSSIYAMMLHAGWSIEAARAIQGLVMCGLICLVAIVWYKKIESPKREALLVLSILLFTPYLFEYDLTLLGLVIAWLGWDCLQKGFTLSDKILLTIGWFAPLVSIITLKAITLSMTPLVLIILLYWVVRRSYTPFLFRLRSPEV